MRKFVLAAALATAAVAAPAFAQEGPYASAGYTHFDGDNVDVGGVTGRLGYRFHPNFAIEGEATIGTNSDDVTVGGVPVNVELDHAYGIYGVGILPVSPSVDLFARLGYANVKATGTSGPFSARLDENGVGYGVGAEWRWNQRWGLRGEYTRLEGDDNGVNTYQAALVAHF